MTRYTNRTCTQCGIRKPQPEMVQKETYVETGRSKSGVSKATWLGMALGDKKSANSVNRWLFNTNQRTYQRKKLVWLCSSCAKTFKTKSDEGNPILGAIVLVIVILAFISAARDNDNNKTNTESSFEQLETQK